MPHLTIEYTANLDQRLDLPTLLDRLHETATRIDAFPLAGMRTRAVRHQHYRFADGHPDNAFVHLTLRLAHGRGAEVLQDAGERLFKTACECLQAIYDSSPLAVSLDIQEMAPEFDFKHGNIRKYIAERQGN